MKRIGLLLTLCAIAGAIPSHAQNYPNRPIRMISPNPHGGANDTIGRIISNKLTEVLGQQMVIDNRGGAGGMIGAEIAAKANNDGYTLLAASSATHTFAPLIYRKVPYDPVKDFTPVSLFAISQNLIVTGRDSPIRSVQDILAIAKSAPQKIALGSINIGSTQHLSTTLFRAQAGTEINAVTYKGTPALMAAVQSGEVQVGFEVLSPILAQVTAGAVRAVAVTTAKRFEGLPAVPTVAESGLPQFVVEGWNGIAAPGKTARSIVDRLNREVNAVLGQPDFRRRLSELAVTPLGGSPEDMGKLLVSEIKRWGAIVAQAKIERQ